MNEWMTERINENIKDWLIEEWRNNKWMNLMCVFLPVHPLPLLSFYFLTEDIDPDNDSEQHQGPPKHGEPA